MKAVTLGKRLKELTEASSYEDALSAVERALAPRPPKGVVITIDPHGSNLYWSTMIGQQFTLEHLLALQAACRDFARLLDGDVRAMIERATEARVRGEMGEDKAQDQAKPVQS